MLHEPDPVLRLELGELDQLGTDAGHVGLNEGVVGGKGDRNDTFTIAEEGKGGAARAFPSISNDCERLTVPGLRNQEFG